jgi:hypothetical protein
MYIVCIYNVYTMYITYIYIVNTEKLDSILHVYTNDIPKLNMEMLPSGQGRWTSLATQTVSSKRLDEIDGL